MNNEFSLIISAFSDKNAAKETAKLLVGKRFAACVQLFPIESVYFWKGEICDDNEVMLFIKSKTALFGAISDIIRENHGYEVPEIIQIPISNGLPEYLKWIDDCVSGTESSLIK